MTVNSDLKIVDDGFVVGDHMVHWSSVIAIAAYKWDLFAYDEICLAFRLNDDTCIEVPENQPDFRDLVEAVQQRFPTVPEEWYREIMLPAFATNYRLLLGQDQTGGSELRSRR